MRIACIDKQAKDRIQLQDFVESAFRDCRASVGHLAVARFFPCSKQELLLSTPPDAIIFGWKSMPEELYENLREVRTEFPDVLLYVVLSEEQYQLKNIERLSKYATEIFSQGDSPTRIVFELAHQGNRKERRDHGSLIAVQGIKGGVGTTSIATGFVHAAHALGKSAIVVDFSSMGEIAQYFLCTSWHSADLAQVISAGSIAEAEQVARMVVTAQNKIPILPPPLGGIDIREKMLRDPARLESVLSVIELLQESYDVVFVDMAHAEGVLPFAIECRADVRLFICSNDPGAVHLLTGKMDRFSLPVDGVTRFVVNQRSKHGLSFEDILDFVAWSNDFREETLYPQVIPYSAAGGLWIGSGNSLYTEGDNALQRSLQEIIADALNIEVALEKKEKPFKKSVLEFLSRKRSRAIPFEDRPKITFNLEEIVDN